VIDEIRPHIAEDGRVEPRQRNRDAHFLLQDLRPAGTDGDMDLTACASKNTEQPDSVRSAARAGHAQDQRPCSRVVREAPPAHTRCSPAAAGGKVALSSGLLPTYSVAIPNVSGWALSPVRPLEASRSSIS